MGCAVGGVAPLVAYLLNGYSLLTTGYFSHPLSLYVLAAAVNLLIVRFFYRSERDRSGRGILLVTFLALLLLLFTTKLSLA